MKRTISLLSLVIGLILGPRWAFAFNPILDIRDNLVWTVGKAAEVGEAIKIGGGGDLKVGETSTSMLASIAQYRFLVFSYGGTRVNRNDENFTDTAKVGFRLNTFFGWFKNPPTPEMAWLQNVNVGPSYAMNLINSPHVGTFFIDLNYQFGGVAK